MRVISAAVIALALAGAASGAATVRMADNATVTTAKVTLADVAVIETANAAERAKMAGVVVAFVGEAEGVVKVDGSTVRQALTGAGVNAAGVRICGAASALVTRLDGKRRESEALAAVEKYIAATAPKDHFTISQVDVEFSAPCAKPVVMAAQPKELSGRVRFDIADAANPDKAAGSVFASVEKSVPVVVARKRVSAGSQIGAADVEVEYRAPSEALEAAGAGEVIGRKAARTVEPGTAVTQKALRDEVAVKRGDQLVLEYDTGGMLVTMKMRALENASVGDVVRLRREGEKSEMLGKIAGPGRAVPVFGADAK